MTDQLQTFALGFGLATAILGFLGKWIFVTKSDLSDALRRHEASESAALKERQLEGKARWDKIECKLDTLLADMGDLRVEFAKVKYSRVGGHMKVQANDSSTDLPSVRR
jgi:hypothetical protein